MLKQLREQNESRAQLWRGEGVPSSGPLFAAVELAGEVGELCNLIKKRERAERGYGGGKIDMPAIIDELADVIICADLLASELGVDLEIAVREKFNRDSAKHNFPQRLEPTLIDQARALSLPQSEWPADMEDYRIRLEAVTKLCWGMADALGNAIDPLDRCPVTGRKYWGVIKGVDGVDRPTYGGPYDVYTIPVAEECEWKPDAKALVRKHYDLDNDYQEEDEIMGWYVVEEKLLIELDELREFKASVLAAAEHAREGGEGEK